MTICKQIISIISQEADSLGLMSKELAQQEAALESAVQTILTRCNGNPGRLICSGMGKAGIIARKCAATFSSTGTPSLYLHPSEARHGDLGMVQEHDCVLLLSNSGSSEELVAILPSLKRIGCHIIGVCGKLESPLAEYADILLYIGNIAEACPLGLAPSASTTAMLALCDGMALTVLDQRNFSSEEYGRYHPGGALGRKLMTAAEVMRKKDRIACIEKNTDLKTAMHAISQTRCGSAVILEEDGSLAGIFTDGDLRRALIDANDTSACLEESVEKHGTLPCRSINTTSLVADAVRLCADFHINALPVIDDLEKVCGLIDLQDLADRGYSI